MRKKLNHLLILLPIILLLTAGICGAVSNEKEQAAQEARSYVESETFSRSRLIEQLINDGFSREIAEYGADHCGSDWKVMAWQSAKACLDILPLSESGLIAQLEYDGFLPEQIRFALDKVSADWNQMALRQAMVYLEFSELSESELAGMLESDGFSSSEAAFGAISALSGEPGSGHILLDTPEFDLTEAVPEEESTVPEQPAEADEPVVGDDMIQVLFENMDNIFPLRSMDEKFSAPSEAVYTDAGPQSVVQVSNQDGARYIRMFANSDSVHDSFMPLEIKSGNLLNFYISMDITIDDLYPSGTGGCFIGYVNEPTGAVKEEDVSYITLFMNDQETGYYRRDKDADAGTFTPAQSGNAKSRNLALIRLTGQTFVFIDKKYVGQFHDNKKGPFQLVYGEAILPEGDSVSCYFDNLIIRKVLN